MKRLSCIVCLTLMLGSPIAPAGVVVNEVFINPAGSSADDTQEFVELLGVPGKKLDGYAVAFCSGTEQKYYMLGTIPPAPNPSPEVDEFFSLDGLSLGTNGLLVVGIGLRLDYGQILDDTHYADWNTIYNGGLDTPGKLQNDGSNTVLLIRNRPGITEADPVNSGGLRWGKDIDIDAEFITPAVSDVCGGATVIPGLPCRTPADCIGGGSTCIPGMVDQYGNGNLDKADSNGIAGVTLDLKGSSTPADISDDLEIVDEVSYENVRGWEYDLDDRRADVGSGSNGLPERAVHQLGDPQGFNPDALIRVDYRTKGPGWTPATGATGDGPGGNNWQDTATEQWIRGESVDSFGGAGGFPQFFLDNTFTGDANAIQPYTTNVPVWLQDGVGTDYDFSMANTYQIMAGRINPLATPFIPGDADRDGDADQDDIDKIAAVFGDDDWIFSNSYQDAPEGDAGDPATQTRPWDVDATGANGIEMGDLQWTLNFFGDTTGQIVGVQYDDTTPAASGVVMNPNTGVAVTVTAVATVPNSRPLTGLHFGDAVQMAVRAEVTSGANMSAGAENGVMQFVHDVTLSSGGVIRVESIQKAGPFATTRTDIEQLQGVSGDLGAQDVNGYTTGSSTGIGAPGELYTVNLRAIAIGSADFDVSPTGSANIISDAPTAMKVGHTWQQGNPASATYPATAAMTVVAGFGDSNGDTLVNDLDTPDFAACVTGPNGGILPDCDVFNVDFDNDVDMIDAQAFTQVFGP